MSRAPPRLCSHCCLGRCHVRPRGNQHPQMDRSTPQQKMAAPLFFHIRLIQVSHDHRFCPCHQPLSRPHPLENHALDNRRYFWDEEGLCRLLIQHFWFQVPFCLPRFCSNQFSQTITRTQIRSIFKRLQWGFPKGPVVQFFGRPSLTLKKTVLSGSFDKFNRKPKCQIQNSVKTCQCWRMAKCSVQDVFNEKHHWKQSWDFFSPAWQKESHRWQWSAQCNLSHRVSCLTCDTEAVPGLHSWGGVSRERVAVTIEVQLRTLASAAPLLKLNCFADNW